MNNIAVNIFTHERFLFRILFTMEFLLRDYKHCNKLVLTVTLPWHVCER